jgi:hypothetical protein
MEANKKTVAMFHICGGGGNKRGLEFIGFKKIYECADWDAAFVNEENEDGNPTPEEERELTNESGRVLLDSDELKKALDTGIGRLEIDGDYDTVYTVYAEELSEEELSAMVNPGQGFHYLDSELHKALIEYGFAEEEVALAAEADDIETLVQDHLHGFDYVKANYEEVEKDDDSGFNIYKVGGKFYRECF